MCITKPYNGNSWDHQKWVCRVAWDIFPMKLLLYRKNLDAVGQKFRIVFSYNRIVGRPRGPAYCHCRLLWVFCGTSRLPAPAPTPHVQLWWTAVLLLSIPLTLSIGSKPERCRVYPSACSYLVISGRCAVNQNLIRGPYSEPCERLGEDCQWPANLQGRRKHTFTKKKSVSPETPLSAPQNLPKTTWSFRISCLTWFL